MGTTYSCVAAFDSETQKVVVLQNAIGEKTTPSWVAFTQSGRVVGQPAKQQASMNASNTIYDIKRIIGRSLDDPVTREEARRFPVPELVPVGGKGMPSDIEPLPEYQPAVNAGPGSDAEEARKG